MDEDRHSRPPEFMPTALTRCQGSLRRALSRTQGLRIHVHAVITISVIAGGAEAKGEGKGKRSAKALEEGGSSSTQQLICYMTLQDRVAQGLAFTSARCSATQLHHPSVGLLVVQKPKGRARGKGAPRQWRREGQASPLQRKPGRLLAAAVGAAEGVERAGNPAKLVLLARGLRSEMVGVTS